MSSCEFTRSFLWTDVNRNQNKYKTMLLVMAIQKCDTILSKKKKNSKHKHTAGTKAGWKLEMLFGPVSAAHPHGFL